MYRLELYPVMAGVDANPLAILATGSDDRRLRHSSDLNERFGRAGCYGLKRHDAGNERQDRQSSDMTNTHGEKRTTMNVKALG